MVNINLLPWRRNLIIYQQRRIYYLFALILSCNIVVFVILNLWVSQQLKQFEERKQSLQTQIKKLLPLQRQLWGNQHNQSRLSIKTLARGNTSLQMSSRLLLAFAQSGANMCFSKMLRQKDHLFLQGYSNSIAALTQNILRWRQKNLFSAVQIDKLSQQQNGAMYFEINAYETWQPTKNDHTAV